MLADTTSRVNSPVKRLALPRQAQLHGTSSRVEPSTETGTPLQYKPHAVLAIAYERQ
jgi:hypothetical protein